MDTLLFDRDYYVQRLEDVDRFRYQHGTGCLSDQLLGQLHATLLDLGYLANDDHIKSALRSIHRYNFRERVGDIHATQRTFALGDEAGLLQCTWPYGGAPRYPFPYSDEVWTGVEYQVAAHLIAEGFLDEGLEIVDAVRARHDGYRRNPWDDVECGHNYVRSMSSWALILALSGFRSDVAAGQIRFDPVMAVSTSSDRWSAPWSSGGSWGTIEIVGSEPERVATVRILGGDQPVPAVEIVGVSPERIRVRDERD